MSEELEEQTFDDAFDEFAVSDNDAELQNEISETDEAVVEATEQDEPVNEAPVEQPRDDMGRFTTEESAEPDWKAEAQQWQHRYNSDLGRQSALQRKIQEQQDQIAQLQKAAQNASQAPQAPHANPNGMTDAKWAEFKEDFPEIAEVMEYQQQIQDRAHQQEIAELKAQLVPIQQQSRQQYVNAQYQVLEQQHPDWKDIAKSTEFRNWLEQQPSAVSQLVESEEAADAAYLIQTFKTASARPMVNDDLKQRRERQLRQGQTISNRGGRPKSTGPAADDFDAAFDYFASKG